MLKELKKPKQMLRQTCEGGNYEECGIFER